MTKRKNLEGVVVFSAHVFKICFPFKFKKIWFIFISFFSLFNLIICTFSRKSIGTFKAKLLNIYQVSLTIMYNETILKNCLINKGDRLSLH